MSVPRTKTVVPSGRAPPPSVPRKAPTIDIAEITAVITNLTVDVARKDSEITDLSNRLAAAETRVAHHEEIIDSLLDPCWRDGELKMLPDVEPDPPTTMKVAEQSPQ